ncbi:hypothetical protein BOTBODRAFT_173840 [Botryobasidium botryosum FD-172 SS1]|uniref:HNH nuclease domain-containing protein n=1 Tax=Botryobasidium botryosum (strain FD-172 SS1) TaxID=930990 RepID=A0A067MUY8_BOTB1|nr:hypothetical protein BOTBODRAFT_173840 [Botryobasidium botryosum FD-172 SS1]
MIEDVNGCENDVELKALADRYLTSLIIPFRVVGGRTPAVSDHPSAIVEETEQLIQEHLQSAHQEQGTLRKLVLRRDDYRCAVTKVHDLKSAFASNKSISFVVQPTRAAHIVPFHFAPSSEEAAQVISRFGGDLFVDDINGADINRLENVITLTSDLHSYFENLYIWLEPVQDSINTYHFGCVPKIAATLAKESLNSGDLITLTSTDTRLHLPDSRLLGLHAACAKVTHASGAAEVIDQILWDLEEARVLSEDGSSSDVLSVAFYLASIPAY